MLKEFRPALLSFLVLSAVTGVAYPLLVTGFAQFFPVQARGDPSLIGQPFSDPKYFWSRPNQGPTNPALKDAVADRVKALREADPANTRPVPADLVTASGSGLDPHISPEAADYQLARVAKARGLAEDKVRALVAAQTEGRSFGLLGEPRVNVLRLNRALDAAK